MAKNNFDQDIENCLQVLQRGGVILYPTDTVWGLGCDATNAEAVEKIFILKKRPSNKSLVVLVADERTILQHTASVDLEVFNFLDNTNHPTTVIYEHALGIAENAIADDGSVAIRLCKDDFCKHLIKRFRKPLVSTSANFSGNPAPCIYKEISMELIQTVDYTVQHRREDETKLAPSRIIKWYDGEVVYIR